MPVKLTDEEFYNRVDKKYNGKVKASGFKNTRSKCDAECLDCNHKWSPLAGNLISKKYNGCPECHKKFIPHPKRPNYIPKTKQTEEEARALAKERHNGTIDILAEFKDASHRCLWICFKCGWKWYATPTIVNTKGTGCPNCAHKRKYTPHEIRQLVFDSTGGTVDMIEETCTSPKEKATMLCLLCGETWEAVPNSIYLRPIKDKTKCRHKKHHLLDRVREQVKVNSDGTISLITEKERFQDNEEVECHCNLCGHNFTINLNSLLYKKRYGCKLCSNRSFEAVVMKALDEKGVLYYHDRKLKGTRYNGGKLPLRADFRFKNYPIVIETDGIQHFSPVVYGIEHYTETVERDKIKNEYCKNNNIILIRITSSPTKEWGTDRHKTLEELLQLLDEAVVNGVVNVDMFRQFDFNKE